MSQTEDNTPNAIIIDDSTTSSKRKGKSDVWEHFNKQMKAGPSGKLKYSGTAICIHCGYVLVAPSTMGTNPAKQHVNKCPKKPKVEGWKSQATLSLAGGQPTNWRFDQERSRRALTKMIILDELPFSHVEGIGFKGFCEELQPKFHVVCRTTIAKDCLKMYHEEKLKLKKYLNEMHSPVSLTTDLWTSVQRLGYMVLTAHFVDNDWILRKKIINFQVVPHPHKGEHLAKSIEGCLTEWGLHKLMTITLDNAKNNDNCVEDLKRRFNKKDGALIMKGQCIHVRCFAHILNLVVQDGIKMVLPTIKRLRRSVKYVRTGSLRMQVFKQLCLEEGVLYKKNLCIDVKTRWNSTYLMISAALVYEKVFDRLHEADTNYSVECLKKKTNNKKKDKKWGSGSESDLENEEEEFMRTRVLDDFDWLKLRSLHGFLEDFFLVTKRVSGSLYVTANTYFDEVTHIKEILMHYLDSDEKCFRDMAKVMSSKFDKYCKLENMNTILIIAIVFYPIFKMEYVKLWYERYLKRYECGLTEMARNKKVADLESKVNDTMKLIYKHYKAESSFMDTDPSNNVDTSSSKSVGGGGKRLSVKDEVRVLLKKKDYPDSMDDLDRYLADEVDQTEGSFDVLAWWKGKLPTYRSLAHMARDVLMIPITSVASESAFSTAGRVLDPFRSSLTPRTLEALICAQDWLRKPMLVINVEENQDTLEQVEEDVLAEIGGLAV